jgi:hypothetical protein
MDVRSLPLLALPLVLWSCATPLKTSNDLLAIDTYAANECVPRELGAARADLESFMRSCFKPTPDSITLWMPAVGAADRKFVHEFATYSEERESGFFHFVTLQGNYAVAVQLSDGGPSCQTRVKYRASVSGFTRVYPSLSDALKGQPPKCKPLG